MDTRELLALLEKHGVPSGLIYRAADMLDDPHFAAREAIVSTPHPQFGTLRMQNVAPRLSATPEFDPHAGARARASTTTRSTASCWASAPRRSRRIARSGVI